MQFTVSGTNRETGARMALQFDATCKAAAERKASQSGMEVHRCEPLRGATDEVEHLAAQQPRRERMAAEDDPQDDHQPRSAGGKSRAFAVVIVLVLVAAAVGAVRFMPQIRGMLHH